MKSRTYKKLFESEDSSMEGVMKRTFGDEIPDGAVELEWSLEQIKSFMQKYLSLTIEDGLPMQCRKRWNYELWLYLMEKYAEGLPLKQIGILAEDHFDAIKLSRNSHKFVSQIINHKGWRLAQRMRTLLRQETMQTIEEGKTSSTLRAQEAELKHLIELERQLDDNIKRLIEYPIESNEYGAIMRNIKDLEKLISKFSGSEMYKHLQMYRAKEEIKAAGSQANLPANPKTITPKLIE